MDKLLALPTSGESFLLQRGGKNILVDGGYGYKKLAAALSSPTISVKHLDIVVCTHADLDHAGGLVNLLDKSAITVGEFWLPGEWGDVLPGLLQDPNEVMTGLLGELGDAPDWVEELGSYQGEDGGQDADEALVHERLGAERREREAGRPLEGVLATPDRKERREGLNWLRRQMSNETSNDAAREQAATRAFGRARRMVQQRISKGQVRQPWATLFLHAIKTAERIRDIAVQAMRHSVNVRWFDFQSFVKLGQASGGEPGLLVPLNAVELVEPPPPFAFMRYLTLLTPVNEQSLVFLSREADVSRRRTIDVVFTADSPLGTGPGYAKCFLPQSEPDRWAIATAPHHGSDNNRMAYDHLQQMVPVLLWVRSGGLESHPGDEFRGQPVWRRACTHCPHHAHPRSLVEVPLRSWFVPAPWPRLRPWMWSIKGTKSHLCSC
ncbi:MBL fold metallo-hydrolase [Kinneretia aquatilis]|uniref:MBL fold metallo-hydrolase n=1 Tax=Kinneretia aquatilis TaxID=2070761 RepID=UPI0014950E43|nr:MBL fold metallo-hydrolase [Paucibacter aquatile]WIV97484.1 MBL fold metallo-hydrolase [Paucibacter aquatile]